MCKRCLITIRDHHTSGTPNAADWTMLDAAAANLDPQPAFRRTLHAKRRRTHGLFNAPAATFGSEEVDVAHMRARLESVTNSFAAVKG